MKNYNEEIKNCCLMIEKLNKTLHFARKHTRETIKNNTIALMNDLVQLLKENPETDFHLKAYAKSIPRIHTYWDACKYWQRLENYGKELYGDD